MSRVELEAATRAAHPDTFRFVDELTSHIEAYILNLAIQKSDGLNIIKASLLLRLASGLEATGLLAARSYYTEALTQMRSLMEALVRLAGLCKQPDLLPNYIKQDELNRIKILKDILEFRKTWSSDIPREPPDDEVARMLDEVQRGIDAYGTEVGKKLGEIKTFTWAGIGQVDHLLYGHYPIASAAVHHSPRDLERRYVVEDDELTSVIVGPEPGDVPHLLLTACKFAFVGFQWFVASIGQEIPDAVEALYKDYSEALERLAEEGMGERDRNGPAA